MGQGKEGIIDFISGSELLIAKAKNGHLTVVSECGLGITYPGSKPAFWHGTQARGCSCPAIPAFPLVGAGHGAPAALRGCQTHTQRGTVLTFDFHLPRFIYFIANQILDTFKNANKILSPSQFVVILAVRSAPQMIYAVRPQLIQK